MRPTRTGALVFLLCVVTGGSAIAQMNSFTTVGRGGMPGSGPQRALSEGEGGSVAAYFVQRAS